MSLDIGNKCVGCSSCVVVCPQKCIFMSTNDEGFCYPKVQQSNCIECGLCVNSCPILTRHKYDSKEIRSFAAYSRDMKIRYESSSGGIFSEIALFILNQGGVIYGAAYNNEFRVKHICVDNINDLHKLRGAKYSQSYLGSCYSEISCRLDTGQKVLFTGTPCQVAGLKTFLKKTYSNLYTLDFVCHGIPSPLVWEKYVQYRTKKDSKGILPNIINLRSKSTGWSKYRYSIEFQYPNGIKYSAKSKEDLFMRLFVGDYINRESCSNCQFRGYNRCSDITLGDFWGIWEIAPEMDDNKGTSLVLIQSVKGTEILNQLRNKLVLKEVSLVQTSKNNPSLLYCSQPIKNREKILNLCINGKFEMVSKFLLKREIKFSILKIIKKIFLKLRIILIR